MSHKPDFTLPRDGKIGMETLRVRRADAIDRMAYHLRLAGMYYEATPDDPDTAAAFESALLDEVGTLGTKDPTYVAGVAFYNAIKVEYDRMKEEDENHEH